MNASAPEFRSGAERRAHRVGAGVGLKPEHYRDILDTAPEVAFFEVHAENYMGVGGAPHRALSAIAERYPLSVHGVGLSIGSFEPLNREHLARLGQVVRTYRPIWVSEHLAWSSYDGRYLNDLLPIPYTEETLDLVCEHVDQLQSALGRRVLIENPATYVRFVSSAIPEVEFLSALARRTGCGLLLDVCNVRVCGINHGFDAAAYIDSFPIEHVDEIHLAGHAIERQADRAALAIDDHGSKVHDDTWALFARALERRGPVPTLIEWDNDVPSWPDLHREALRAEAIMARHGSTSAEAAHAAA